MIAVALKNVPRRCLHESLSTSRTHDLSFRVELSLDRSGLECLQATPFRKPEAIHATWAHHHRSIGRNVLGSCANHSAMRTDHAPSRIESRELAPWVRALSIWTSLGSPSVAPASPKAIPESHRCLPVVLSFCCLERRLLPASADCQEAARPSSWRGLWEGARGGYPSAVIP
jgi:hypothetical protein